MKLYLIKREETETSYDEALGFVVAAESYSEARWLAGLEAGDEGPDSWSDEDEATCLLIAKSTHLPAGVVLRDFNAG